jgi:hypothetical protein
VNTLIAPRKPVGSSPDDDDQTGVRAILSALPEPDPMPAYLVERISASLAAEQAQRADAHSGTSVSPMLATLRRRRGRLLFAIAGAAAAVVLFGVAGNTLLTTGQTTNASTSAGSAITSGAREADGLAAPSVKGATPPSADDKAAPGRFSKSAPVLIRLSDVRYTKANFVAQASNLRSATFASIQPLATGSPDLGPIGTDVGLTDCLKAIGADGAQTVQADLAFYEGQPAVIIVATTDAKPTAYVVGRECSQAHADLLRPATPLN